MNLITGSIFNTRNRQKSKDYCIKTSPNIIKPERYSAITSDNVMLALRRYEAKGQQPVLLLHGMCQNMNGWDLPVKDKSLAKQLFKEGLDVWLLNFRNHGTKKYQSGTTNNCSLDDLAIYDLPAAIRQIKLETGKNPFIIGHSMGGIVAVLYHMGLKHTLSKRALFDEKLSKKRNNSTKGLCLVGTPLPLQWKRDPGIIEGIMKPGFDYNILYKRMLGSSTALKIWSKFEKVTISSVFKKLDSLKKSMPLIGNSAKTIIKKAIAILGVLPHPFSDQVWSPDNMDINTVAAEIEHTLNDTPSGIIFQLCDWIKNSTMREYTDMGSINDPIDYMFGLSKITTPVLTIAGEKDKAACADIAYEQGFCKLSSKNKEFKLLKGFGHNDLRIGNNAKSIVYPIISSWIFNRLNNNASNLTKQKYL